MSVGNAEGFFSPRFTHELLWLMALSHLCARLALGPGAAASTWILTFVSLAATQVGLAIWSHRSSSALAMRSRLFFMAVIMNVTFTSIKSVVPLLGLDKNLQDNAIMAIDKFLVGGDLSLWCYHHLQNPVLTEIMSIGYLSFLPFLLGAFILYLFTPIETNQRFTLGLFSLYAVGITLYVLVPATGPYVHLADYFAEPPQGFFFTRLNADVVASGTAVYDVFPSLHCGVGLFLLMSFWRDHRRLAWCYLPFWYQFIC